MKKNDLRSLVDTEDIAAVWREVETLLRRMSPRLDLAPARTAFRDMRRLFAGRYPGWRACNTEYHDEGHTADTLLAMMRLVHGASTSGVRFTDDELTVAALSAMYHDSGYIQAEGDTEGTGAKYTACHVERSAEFLSRYLREKGFPPEYPAQSEAVLLCTGLHVDISRLRFGQGNFKLLGQMLGAGDLLGQMASRTYLEKLLFLYREFQEGKVAGFTDEFDLLQKTFAFYGNTHRRLAGELGGVDRYMQPHFKARWDMDKDLYAQTIAQNLDHLRRIIDQGPEKYRDLLRRDGLMTRLSRLYGRGPR